MLRRDQLTPPFNSPYPPGMKSSPFLHSSACPSPARSDCEPMRYSDGLGLYHYSQPYPTSGPPSSTVLLPPSPQPTEAWAHLSATASPLVTDDAADAWNPTFDHLPARSPLPWGSQHASNRSSLSSTRNMSIYSRQGSEHAYPNIKLEGGSDWTDEESSPPMLQHPIPLTVAPERLSTGLYTYEPAYQSPPLPAFRTFSEDYHREHDFDPMPFGARGSTPQVKAESPNPTARTRHRRSKTTEENANHRCELCGRLFQRAYNYKTHMETHNPQRKKEHGCHSCERTFVRKTDLERHNISVHKRKRDWRCPKCGNEFARKDTLRRHEEDGCSKRDVCSKRNELHPSEASMLSRNRSMHTPLPCYPSPRHDLYFP